MDVGCLVLQRAGTSANGNTASRIRVCLCVPVGNDRIRFSAVDGNKISISRHPDVDLDARYARV